MTALQVLQVLQDKGRISRAGDPYPTTRSKKVKEVLKVALSQTKRASAVPSHEKFDRTTAQTRIFTPLPRTTLGTGLARTGRKSIIAYRRAREASAVL